MSPLDTLFLAGGLLHANATAADHVINAGLYYGPGILLTAVAVTGWRGLRWCINRHQDRADRRYYAAVAYRLNRVADRADTVLAQDDDDINAYLEALYNTPAHASKEES
ncbi:hypothetical protein PV334_20130 [Streptomyces sp. ME02-7008A-1]|uniref:hypothetical protein n=1 Tax=unclassified Streptomyces TaxID=2593676 RepID=UPI0029BD9D00|nr:MULTISPECIES: hypothetical protein [unclassified Streptomyces]MDX3183558.1 hypothetical protein [Streptomyces sp. ME02-7008A-1]MDX3304010.1 hypothetical protein [Streptomyces sp. ME02-7008A]